MATHVANRTVAEVVPAMPFMRMKVRVIIAVRRRTNPRIPIQTGGDGESWRARPHAAIGPVGPAMGLGDLADDAGPDVFAQTAVAFLAMALIPHLGGDL